MKRAPSDSTKKLPRGIDFYRGGYRVRVTFEGKQVLIGHWEMLDLAELALRQAHAEIITRTFVPPAVVKRQRREAEAKALARGLTLNQWVTQWLDDLENGSKPRSAGTIASYRSTLNQHVLPELGDKRLVDITEFDVTSVVDASIASGAGASRNVARTLRALFNRAVETNAGGLDTSPVSHLKIPSSRSTARGDDKVPTLDEIRKITANMPDATKLAVSLAVWCQLRLSEVLGLQRGDFKNLETSDHAVLSVDRQWNSKVKPPDYTLPKGSKTRRVAVPPALVPKIRSHFAAMKLQSPDAPVFSSPRDTSRPLSHTALGRQWDLARDAVHPGLSFHALRHAGLTFFAQSGATTAEIMRRGGHSDIESAAVYQHSSAERDRLLASKLDDLIEAK